METYGEIIYMVTDELKLASDDRTFEEEHIINLLHHYRNLLLKQRYSDVRRDIALPNFQYIKITLDKVDSIPNTSFDSNTYLKSNIIIPNILNLNAQNVTKISAEKDFWSGEISFVDTNQFKYVGYNKWLNNIIYACIGPDDYLYLKSNNPQFLYLKSLAITSIFENPREIHYLLDSPTVNNKVNILDKEFPLEGNLVPLVKEAVIKELMRTVYQPEDNNNNSDDDLDKVNIK